MSFGLLVYNTIFEKDPKWTPQISLILKSFQCINHPIKPVNNFNALEVIKSNLNNIDFVIFYDKDVALAELIEAYGIPTFNSARAIRICDDKALTYAKFVEKKIPTPKTMVMPFLFGRDGSVLINELLKKLARNGFNFPLVYKERKGSFGDQVYLINNPQELNDIIRKTCSRDAIIQEYIKDARGVDYRVVVVGNTVIACAKRVNKNDFRSNVNQGGVMIPFNNLPHHAKKIAINAAKACKCEYAGVDIIFDRNGNCYVLEVNSNPRTLAMENATKINITANIAARLIKRIRYRKKVELKYKDFF